MPWSREDITRLIELEAHKRGIDPRLGLALAEQESGFDPQARSPKGATGIFQLMPATARQLKVDPSDVAQNISGGLDYFKQQLDAFGGDTSKALAAYNAGPGVVKAYGKVPPYKETQGYVSRILSKLGPSLAEAATPQGQPQASGMTRLQELEAHRARLLSQAAQPPTATSTPEQDAAYRASRGQQEPATAPQTPVTTLTQPGASQAPPEPSPDPSATPGMRFQALPSITQLEPQDRLQKTKLFESLKPALQEEFLRDQEPAAGGLAVGGGPVAQSQPVTDPLALLAVGRGAPSREQQILAEARARQQRGETKTDPAWRGVPPEAPLEEGITAPSTMIPLLMPGAGVKAVAPVLKQAGPLITRGARALAEGLSQTAGWTAGRTAETGKVPSPGEIGTEAAWNVGVGGALEIPGAILRKPTNAVLRRTPGAQTLLNQQAVQEAEGLGKRVFNAQDKEVVGKAFDAVVATGEKLDIAPVRNLWKTLTVAEQRVATNELNKISSTFAGSLKTPTSTWDIGELQHLRSELGKASGTKRTPETIDILQSLRGSIDDAIHNGMAKGSLPAAELVDAQKAWRKVMQAEDLQSLVTRHTKDSPNLKWQELNLAALNKEIRGGGKKSTQRLVAGMGQTERQVLQQELDGLKRHYPFIRITPTAANVVNLASLVSAGGRALSGDIGGALMSLTPVLMTAAISSPAIMGLFKRGIVEGKGQLSAHSIDAIINAIRHENEQAPGTVRVTPAGAAQ